MMIDGMGPMLEKIDHPDFDHDDDVDDNDDDFEDDKVRAKCYGGMTNV